MAEYEKYMLSKPAEWIDEVFKGAVVGTKAMPELSEQFKAQFRENIGATSSDASWQPKGYFDTVEELQASITKPKPGDAYGVGLEPPYDIWVWDGLRGRWLNNGPIKGMDGAPGKDGIDGKDAVITPEQVEAGLGYNPGMVNPNLLDNWYFGNPVNQRGQTEYTATGYTIDRWLSRRAAIRMVLNSDSITVSDTSNAAQGFIIDQRAKTDLLDFLSGKKVTFSVLVKNAAGCIAQCGTNQIKIDGVGLFYKPFYFNKYSGENLICRIYNSAAGGSADIIAIKLELGNNQTLAHQDSSGNWVLNEIPNYAEQLARCQRFQTLLPTATGTAPIATGWAYSETSIRVTVPLPVPLRATPVIEYLIGDISKLSLSGAGTAIIPTGASVLNTDGAAVVLVFTVPTAVKEECYALRTNNQIAKILIAANL